MKTYKINLVFTDPYIGSRNGGNKTVDEGLSLTHAKKRLLEIFNDKSDIVALTWAEAKRKTKKRIDSAYGSGTTARFDFDGRRYEIVSD